MSSLDKDDQHCQPCDKFNDNGRMYNTHCCPVCDGLRYFCDNCHADHHKGGWNSCGPDDKMAACSHPLCKARIAAEKPKAVQP